MVTFLDLGIQVLLTQDLELLALVQRTHVDILSTQIWDSSDSHHFQVKGHTMSDENGVKIRIIGLVVYP